MSDHYATLGVQKNSTPDEIKKAYRKKAAQHHPDRGGNTAEFQKIEEAYRILSDPQQRQQYDNPHQGHHFQGGFPGGFSFSFGGNPFEDILSQFHRQAQQQRTPTYSATIQITLEQAVKGESSTFHLNTNSGLKEVKINIPAGIDDGQQVKYDGMVDNSPLVVTFRITRHPKFERRGLDLYQKVDVNIFDLIIGTSFLVTDIYGNELTMTVPPKTKTDTTFRLQGKGVSTNGRTGDMFILLSVVIPDTISDQLLDTIRNERKQPT
jgi:curved DNA-binding protein